VAAGIVRAILEGLSEAHRLGIVHRDLKPENVLLAGDPGASDFNLKIVDFGLAHVAGGGRPDGGGFAGTLGYMAPEQAEAADTVDLTADVYSVSVILYELLMGNRPNVRWEPISKHRREVPPELDALIDRGLSVYQRSRPASAAEFSEALDEALAGARPAPEPRVPDPEPPPPPPPPPVGESFLDKARRQWAGLSMAQKAGTVTVGVLLAIGANWRPDPPPPCNPAVEVCPGTGGEGNGGNGGSSNDGSGGRTGGSNGGGGNAGNGGRTGGSNGGGGNGGRTGGGNGGGVTPTSSRFDVLTGAWRDEHGGTFSVVVDGDALEGEGTVPNYGPVSLHGSFTSPNGVSLEMYDAADRLVFRGTGQVEQGSGGLDVKVTYRFPNNTPAFATTIHTNH
jgi:hypothetical protein